MNDLRFHSSLVGGYNKNQVRDYISDMENEYQARVDQKTK